jgi:hypothetical protein
MLEMAFKSRDRWFTPVTSHESPVPNLDYFFGLDSGGTIPFAR